MLRIKKMYFLIGFSQEGQNLAGESGDAAL